MRTTFEVVTKNFENALVQYKIATGKAWKEVVRQQARIVAEKLMKMTPPIKKKGMSEKKIGEMAVARDVNKVFADLGGMKFENATLDKKWKAGDFKGVQAMLPGIPGWEKSPIPTYERIFAQPINNIHQAARGNRKRPVPKEWETRYAVAGKNAQKRYIKTVQKHVGKSKSGWLAAIIKLGGKAPAWVSRHGAGLGTVKDGSATPNNPFVEMCNNAIAVSNKYAVKQVLKFQTKIMLKDAARIMKGGKFKFR